MIIKLRTSWSETTSHSLMYLIRRPEQGRGWKRSRNKIVPRCDKVKSNIHYDIQIRRFYRARLSRQSRMEVSVDLSEQLHIYVLLNVKNFAKQAITRSTCRGMRKEIISASYRREFKNLYTRRRWQMQRWGDRNYLSHCRSRCRLLKKYRQTTIQLIKWKSPFRVNNVATTMFIISVDQRN